MNKTAIPDINWCIAKFGSIIPAQLIQISPQMTMTTDAVPSEWGSTFDKKSEMIAIAHGTWNKRQMKQSSYNMEVKAITQGLRSFAKTFKNLRVQSLAIKTIKVQQFSTSGNVEHQYHQQRKSNRGHGEIAIDALNQTWKKELPWIHPLIPLLSAVLKKIREVQIEAMIIAPLWPGQIWHTEQVNENARSLMLGWSNEILEI
ncbi:MAG: hypothetical protein EZS28_047531 [Streblomastix strix]|uniref:Uncharacterized protein n=1 Tax=Streblomastix strix TaxID=222440 RepID=A0A5J4TGC6_9EUKA|nr:MAG: hypothetical protein EZS28_047531 [Streblomastix strix]